MLRIDKSVKIVNVNTWNRCQEECVQIWFLSHPWWWLGSWKLLLKPWTVACCRSEVLSVMLGSDEHKAGALRTISVQNCIINQCSLLRGIPVLHNFFIFLSWLFHEFPKHFGTTYLPIHLTGLCPETTGPGTVHGYCFSAVRGDGRMMRVGLSGVSASVGKHPSVFHSKYHKNIQHQSPFGWFLLWKSLMLERSILRISWCVMILG